MTEKTGDDKRVDDTSVTTINARCESPPVDYGVAHHGAPILTRRDYEYCLAMVEWIQTARTSGKFGYGDTWLPTGVDIEKSRLFWRLRSGKEPLPHRPPTCYSCPWYEVVEELTPHWTMECWVAEAGTMMVEKATAFIGQCGYDIVKRAADGSPEIVTFGPYRFKVWAGKHPENKVSDGWYIQCVPQELETGTDSDLVQDESTQKG